MTPEPRQRDDYSEREKFATVNSFGPQQVVEFHNTASPEEQTMQARRAFELMRQFLRHFD